MWAIQIQSEHWEFQSPKVKKPQVTGTEVKKQRKTGSRIKNRSSCRLVNGRWGEKHGSGGNDKELETEAEAENRDFFNTWRRLIVHCRTELQRIIITSNRKKKRYLKCQGRRMENHESTKKREQLWHVGSRRHRYYRRLELADGVWHAISVCKQNFSSDARQNQNPVAAVSYSKNSLVYCCLASDIYPNKKLRRLFIRFTTCWLR